MAELLSQQILRENPKQWKFTQFGAPVWLLKPRCLAFAYSVNAPPTKKVAQTE